MKILANKKKKIYNMLNKAFDLVEAFAITAPVLVCIVAYNIKEQTKSKKPRE
tara:strand:- start:251 stop:406 length:156 start_codon:yes stop_codon:yes gene_type:complete